MMIREEYPDDPKYPIRTGFDDWLKPKTAIAYDDLGYGVWQLEDGREMLFNRRFKGIWLRDPEGHVERVEAKHVGNLMPGVAFTERRQFWTDGTAPHLNKTNWAKAERTLLLFLTGQPVEHLRI